LLIELHVVLVWIQLYLPSPLGALKRLSCSFSMLLVSSSWLVEASRTPNDTSAGILKENNENISAKR
jgi:hypothetical protein